MSSSQGINCTRGWTLCRTKLHPPGSACPGERTLSDVGAVEKDTRALSATLFHRGSCTAGESPAPGPSVNTHTASPATAVEQTLKRIYILMCRSQDYPPSRVSAPSLMSDFGIASRVQTRTSTSISRGKDRLELLCVHKTTPALTSQDQPGSPQHRVLTKQQQPVPLRVQLEHPPHVSPR